MIHILDYKGKVFDKNQKISLQYVTLEVIFEKVLSQTKYVQKILQDSDLQNPLVVSKVDYYSMDLNSVCNYIDSFGNIKLLIINVDIFAHSPRASYDILNELTSKYKDIKFIVFNDETFLRYTKTFFEKENIFFISNVVENPYSFINKVHDLHRFASYYIMNLYLQERYNNAIQLIFEHAKRLIKSKKFNFYNGIHKPHRLKSYELIKKNDLLKDGFFSYLDYTNFKNDESQYQEFMNFLNIDSKEQYLDYLNKFEIPYLCDFPESDTNYYVAFALPPQYSLQSYVCITTETIFPISEQAKNIHFSEKALKAFFGFNIPLLLGHHTTIKYFKDLKFDMFEDLFDVSPKDTKEGIFEQFDNNLKVIKNMSDYDLYNFYVSNVRRVEENFEKLTKKMKEHDLYNLNNFLPPVDNLL